MITEIELLGTSNEEFDNIKHEIEILILLHSITKLN